MLFIVSYKLQNYEPRGKKNFLYTYGENIWGLMFLCEMFHLINAKKKYYTLLILKIYRVNEQKLNVE